MSNLHRPSIPSSSSALKFPSRLSSKLATDNTRIALSSCQDNSIRDASPVGPSLGTTHCRSCILLFSGHSFSFPYVSLPFFFPRIPGSPSFLFYFLLSYRTQDNTPTLLVAYLYIIPLAWPRPRERERPIRILSNPSNLRPFLPLLARVPSPQDSCYARYDSPRAFSAARERGVSFPPLRLCFPFGTANPHWILRVRFELTGVDLPPALH